MKRIIQGLMVLGFVTFFAMVASAYNGTYPAGSGVNGSPHDMYSGNQGTDYLPVPADSKTRICIYCHAPHNTYKIAGTGVGAGPEAPDAAFDYLPLWNHELQTDIVYTMYDNGPGEPLVGDKHSQAKELLQGVTTPGSVSLLCLSCHDGSVAVNTYGNGSQPTASQSLNGTKFISGQYVIGQDKYLGNHHPISFNYDTVQAQDQEIRTSDHLVVGSTSIADHLYNGNMECATCHSVHNTGNAGESLLWRSDQNSEFCLTCHAKGPYTTAPSAPLPPQ